MMIEERDIAYGLVAGEELLARVYHCPTVARGHAIVSVHGGAWCRNDRLTARVLDRGLARHGLTVFALDFRQGPAHKFPAATQDITAGVRFVRANAESFGVDPDTIGIVGSSSGGQSVLLSSLTIGSAQNEGTSVLAAPGQALDASSVSARVAYAVALWPVSDPLYRYRYAQETGREELLEGHRAYFHDESDMHKASIRRILDDGEASTLPPLFIVQPGADTNVPQDMTFALLRALQASGTEFDYAFYPGQPHALTREDTPAAARCISDTAAFIDRRLQMLARQ